MRNPDEYDPGPGLVMCEYCEGSGYVDDPESVVCGDSSCCSPAPMYCPECLGAGAIDA